MIIIGIVLFLALGFGFTYHMWLTYGFPWNRYGSSYVVRGDQTIEKIEFTVDDYLDHDSALLRVYLRSEGRFSKLSPEDTLTLNNQIIESEYFNSGASSGYQYISDIPKAQEYVLIIKRAGKEDVRKSIKTEHFSPSIPAKVSKSVDLIIAYAAVQTPHSEEIDPTVIFSSTIEDPGARGNKGAITVSGSRELEISDEEMKIEATKIIIAKEELKRLKNGRVNLKVVTLFRQEDGTLVVAAEKAVEIVE